MLDVCLLGTAGMMPLPNRWLTSCIMRYNGSSLLIDCGEGTQIALRETGLSANPIDVILFTHFHADHISGLPGMLLNMANADRTDPVLMVGPKGIERVVSGLRVIVGDLPFDIEYKELTEAEERFEINGFHICAFRVKHSTICYGYSVDIHRLGKFDLEAAKSQNIPVQFWNRLQHGQAVTEDGITYTPDMVMGQARKGLKVTYSTDSRPCDAIVDHAAGSDLFICEGMYCDESQADKARKKKHMTFCEAATMARDAGVNELWLTHFSPSMVGAKHFIKDAQKIFPETRLGEDGKFVELDFVED